MANPEHVEILRQGEEAWNTWRGENFDTRPDLVGADLVGADLSWANLMNADLSRTALSHARLMDASLIDANLDGANLSQAVLDGANLVGANLSQATLFYTTFVRMDLRGVGGLEEVHHSGPSSLGIDTLYTSKGDIPEAFLRGCGVPEGFITYAQSLVGSALEFYSCFISYSHADEEFTERLEADLQSKGVRCWFAPHDLPIGAETRQGIDDAIRRRDKLVVVLSERSIDSRWVQKEVETAFAEEERRGRLVLFPVRIDNAVMETERAWAADLRRMRNIGDLTQWKDHDAYQTAFQRVLRDLQSEGSLEVTE